MFSRGRERVHWERKVDIHLGCLVFLWNMAVSKTAKSILFQQNLVFE